MKPNRARLAGMFILVAAAVPGLGCSSTESTTTTTSATTPSAKDRESAVTLLNDATKTLGEMKIADLVPAVHLEKAQCTVVVPALVSGGLIVGASHGRGVATCRTHAGWSGPIFLTLSGGSFGAQAGVQSSDLLMLVMSKHGMSRLFTSGFKLGADASAAAGPVGQGKATSTDASMKAEILTYSRSRGLFAGVNLNGASVSQDMSALAALYGPGVSPQAILDGRVPAPAESHAFINAVSTTFPVASPTVAMAQSDRP